MVAAGLIDAWVHFFVDMRCLEKTPVISTSALHILISWRSYSYSSAHVFRIVLFFSRRKNEQGSESTSDDRSPALKFLIGLHARA